MRVLIRPLAALLLAGGALLATSFQSAPPTPTGLTGTALSPTSITWSWGNVSGETGYEIHDASHAVLGTTWQDLTSWTETGLNENTEYARHVHSVNSVGSSGASTTSEKYSGVHDATSNDFSLTVVSASRIDVSVALLPNHNIDSTGCWIERSTDNATWENAKSYSSTYTLQDQNLVSGTTYYYRVTYRNGNGTPSLVSPVKSATTLPGAPAASTPLSSSAQSTSSILWSWPDVEGETGYELHTSTHVVVASRPAGMLTYLEAGLSENTQYTRHLHAVNAAGSSAASANGVRYTKVHDPTIADFSLTVVSGTQINVTVTQPPHSGTGTSTACQIDRSTDGITWNLAKSLNSTWTLQDGAGALPPLVPGTTYYYRIKYRNGDGAQHTSFSPPRVATTSTALPPAPTNLAASSPSVTTLSWTWNDVNGETGYRVHNASETVLATNEADVVAFLETGLTENTQYTRHVHAFNAVGQGAASAAVSKYTRVREPSASDFSLTVVSATQITVNVSAAGLTAACQVERSSDNFASVATTTTVQAYATNYTIPDQNLVPGTRYYYRIRYRNGDSSYTSAYSTPKSVVTSDAPPPTPTGLVGVGVSTTSVRWSWTNGPVETGYALHDAAEAVIGTTGPDVTTLTETGFSENSPVTRHLHATNASGSSGASTGYTAYSMVHAPTTADFTVVQLTGTSIQITVTPPPNGGADATGVEISRSTNQTTWSAVRPFSNIYTWSNTGLSSGTLYYYRIRFQNGNGTPTTYSPARTASPPPAPTAAPAAPVGFAGTALSTTSLLWSWNAVANESGHELHDAAHTVIASPGIDELQFVESGFSENTSITRHLHAVNSIGSSPASASVTRWTAVRTPTTADFSLTVVSPTRIDITVNPLPNSTSNTGCEIERSVDNFNWTQAKGFNGTYADQDTALVAGTTYYYRIRYRNGDAQYVSPYSPPLIATTPAAPPPAPTSLAGSALSTSALRWTWGNVAGENGFVLHNGTEGVVATIDADVLNHDETGLSENTAYPRHVHAFNGEGDSASSNIVTRWTAVHTPTQADFSLSVVSANRIDILVVVPPNGGLNSSACEVERSPDGFTWNNVQGLAQNYTIQDTEVVGGTLYYYRIRFRNGDGQNTTPFSPPRSATTPPGEPPAPATFSGAPASSGSILWTWANVGGEANYLLHDDAETVKATLAADVVSYLETGLGENALITRHVHAANAIGTGNPSPLASKFTLIHEPTLSDFTLEAMSGTHVRVTVVAPPNPANDPTTGCEIQRSPDTFNWTTSKSWSSEYVSNEQNLVGSTTYYYRIRFRNGDGTMTAFSPMKTITTPAAPPAAPAVATSTALSMTSIRWTWLNVQGESSYVLHGTGETVHGSTARDVVNLTETGLSENTAYTRHVHAVNDAGMGDPSIDMVRTTWIRNPTTADFTLTPVDSTRIDVTVTPPPNSTVGNTAVAIQRSTDGLSWTSVKSFSVAGYAFQSTGLAAKTTYHYRIQFRNGDSSHTTPWSAYSSATTHIGAPTAFAGAGQSTSSILWSWANQTGETGFLVHDAAHQVIGTTGADVLTFLESGLQENSAHARHVHATDEAGTSSPSATVSRYTLLHDPAPEEFTLNVVSSSQIDVSVTPPANSTLGTTGVEISRSTDQTNWTVFKGFSATYTGSALGLNGSTTYYFRIRLRNGDSVTTAYSDSKNATTLPTPPPAPATFSASVQSSSSIQWSWTNVAGETGYVLHDSLHALKAMTAANVATYVENDLPENSPITRHVHAFNDGGQGPPSGSLTPYTPVHDATIADFTMTVVSSTQIDVIVVPPNNGSLGSTAVEVQRSTNGNNWTTVKEFNVVGYTASDTGVQNNKDYQYRIRFRSANGYAPVDYSPAQSVSTKPPVAPAGFTGAGQSASSILWSWSEIIGETGYQVHDPSELVKASSEANEASATEINLQENTAYTRHVHAINGVGTSPASATATRSTLVHPATLADFSLTLASASQVNVTVVSPPNSTTGATAVQIQRSPDNAAWTTIKDFNVVGYAFNDPGLAAGATFYYRIRFQNIDGLPSDVSPARSITTPAADAPFITTTPKRTRNQNTAVAGTAAPGLTVKVYFNGVYDGTATGTSGTWTYSSTLKPEGEYTVVARASNGGQESTDSNSVAITVDLTPPPAPANIRTTAFKNCVDVEWDPSAAEDVAGYQVFRKEGPTGTWILLNTSGLVLGTRFRDAGLSNGTLYYYRVAPFDTAVND